MYFVNKVRKGLWIIKELLNEVNKDEIRTLCQLWWSVWWKLILWALLLAYITFLKTEECLWFHSTISSFRNSLNTLLLNFTIYFSLIYVRGNSVELTRESVSFLTAPIRFQKIVLKLINYIMLLVLRVYIHSHLWHETNTEWMAEARLSKTSKRCDNNYSFSYSLELFLK